MGPMVVAGLMLENESELEGLNVKDSKKCTPKRREKLAQELYKIAKTEVIIVPARDIDTMREGLTMNQIETKLFASIIEKLKPSVAYVDSADVNEERFGQDIKNELDLDVKIVSKHGADELYPIVSAASIIAKTTRDFEVGKIAEKIGCNIGSGYPSDVQTISFLEKWIAEHGEPPPHTRVSWKTTQNILNRILTKKIETF
ncbi:MAG: ribonuclease HII [Methanomassiliicoccales archaeon]|nr:MAG: ribonuclease HII [Methanomassiliicoccales archaeon]